MLTKRELVLGGLVGIFLFLAGYFVGQNVARNPDQTDAILLLKVQNDQLKQSLAAAQSRLVGMQSDPNAAQTKIDGLQIQVDAANRRVQTEADTVIDLQHQLDKANGLLQQEANEALDAEQERDSAQQQVGNITPAIEQAHIHSVERAMNVACQARLLNVEAQVKLLPASGPATAVFEILKKALEQQDGGSQ